jgi:hypothetical protein
VPAVSLCRLWSWRARHQLAPELDQLRAHLSALMPYRVAAGVLGHLLPVAAGQNHETMRSHTLKTGQQLRADAGVQSRTAASAITPPLIRPSFVAVIAVNGISRFASAMSKHRGTAAGLWRCRRDRHRHGRADPAKPRDGSAEPPTPQWSRSPTAALACNRFSPRPVSRNRQSPASRVTPTFQTLPLVGKPFVRCQHRADYQLIERVSHQHARPTQVLTVERSNVMPWRLSVCAWR